MPCLFDEQFAVAVNVEKQFGVWGIRWQIWHSKYKHESAFGDLHFLAVERKRICGTKLGLPKLEVLWECVKVGTEVETAWEKTAIYWEAKTWSNPRYLRHLSRAIYRLLHAHFFNSPQERSIKLDQPVFADWWCNQIGQKETRNEKGGTYPKFAQK